jgi:hypothetical protein
MSNVELPAPDRFFVAPMLATHNQRHFAAKVPGGGRNKKGKKYAASNASNDADWNNAEQIGELWRVCRR